MQRIQRGEGEIAQVNKSSSHSYICLALVFLGAMQYSRREYYLKLQKAIALNCNVKEIENY